MEKHERTALGFINHEVFNNSGLPQTLFAISDSNKTGYDGLSMFVKDPLNKDATLNAERTALSADTKRTHVWLHVFRLGSLVYLWDQIFKADAVTQITEEYQVKKERPSARFTWLKIKCCVNSWWVRCRSLHNNKISLWYSYVYVLIKPNSRILKLRIYISSLNFIQ